MIAYILLGVSLLITVTIWMKLRVVLRLFRVAPQTLDIERLESLPAVSVCIPARDEMHAMTACLESVLLSRYPKLEIIVLDDGSRDNTGHLIKSFAHSGVRFVEGAQLPEQWLGKNHALKGLLKEASGELIVFADVDTHFSPDSISHMVAYMLSEGADMVSVLPRREVSMRASAVFATYRHFWSILGHTVHAPASSSSAWMVRRELMEQEFASFETIKNDVRPDKRVASALAARGAYRYVISDRTFGLSYDKRLSSQYETSVRIYYPDFGLRGVVFRMIGIVLLLTSYVLVLVGLLAHDLLMAMSAFAVTIVISLLNAWYLGVLRSHGYGIATICLPFLMIRELYLLAASVVLHRRHKVMWKGRPVTAVYER
ncbi:MAG: glycosyltransferase [Candidatus Saccharimonadales bacterium]